MYFAGANWWTQNLLLFIKDPNDKDSVTSNPSRIGNVLNDPFASVGPKLINKLPTVQRNYFDFMNRSNSPDSSFAFQPSYPSRSGIGNFAHTK